MAQKGKYVLFYIILFCDCKIFAKDLNSIRFHIACLCDFLFHISENFRRKCSDYKIAIKDNHTFYLALSYRADIALIGLAVMVCV